MASTASPDMEGGGVRFIIPVGEPACRLGACCFPRTCHTTRACYRCNNSTDGGNKLRDGWLSSIRRSDSFFSTGCLSISPLATRAEVIVSTCHAPALQGASICTLRACIYSKSSNSNDITIEPGCPVRIIYDPTMNPNDLLLSQTAFTSSVRQVAVETTALAPTTNSGSNIGSNDTNNMSLDKAESSVQLCFTLHPYDSHRPVVVTAPPRVQVQYVLNVRVTRSHTQSYSEECIRQICEMSLSNQIVHPGLVYVLTPWLAVRCTATTSTCTGTNTSTSTAASQLNVIGPNTTFDLINVDDFNVDCTIGNGHTDMVGARCCEVTEDGLYRCMTESFVGSKRELRCLSQLIASCGKGFCPYRGAVIVGGGGSGKSHLANSLLEHINNISISDSKSTITSTNTSGNTGAGASVAGSSRSLVIDCRNFTELHRGVAEEILLNVPNRLTAAHRLLVFENIDEFSSRSASGRLQRDTNDLIMSDAFITDALNRCIDTVVSQFPHCFIIATSAVGAKISKSERGNSLHIDESITQAHRLSNVIHLQPLGKADRAELICSILSTIERDGRILFSDEVMQFLRSNQVHFTKENDDRGSINYTTLLANEIASRTPGLSALDLISLIKLQLREICNDTSGHNVTTLSAADVLKAASEAVPSDLRHGNSTSNTSGGHALNLLTDVSDAADLPGYESILQELIDETLGFYSGPQQMRELYKQMGLTPTSGIVISGPSGVGKTALARLLGRRCQSYFKFISVSCAELVHKVVGETEQKLSQLFASARTMAPCFLLLDNLEIIMGGDTTTTAPSPCETSNTNSDTLKKTSSRINSSNADSDSDSNEEEESEEAKKQRIVNMFKSKRTSSQAFDRLLSTLLIEIDGIGSVDSLRIKTASGSSSASSSNDIYAEEGPVIVIATTTDGSLLDSALTRPGRLEKHVKLGLPTAAQRLEILRHLLRGLLDPTFVDADRLINDIVAKTEGRPPSALHEVVVAASMAAAREAIEKATETTPQDAKSSSSNSGRNRAIYRDESQYLKAVVNTEAPVIVDAVKKRGVLLFPRHFDILYS